MAEAEIVAKGVRRVLAPNPSALTYHGTNSYIVGTGRVAVIDPGPAMPEHLDALLAALRPGEAVGVILVTHAHLDHSGLARPLAEATGAPVYAAGGAEEGRSASMQALAASGFAEGGEGLDREFSPDRRLADGAVLTGADWQLTALATPGHLGTHLAFALGEVLFTGDHVMAWSTTLVSPPDGDMGAYMASLARLQKHPSRLFLPGHGPAVVDPARRVAELIAHRKGREAAILERLGPSGQSARTLAQAIYSDIPSALLAAAERNVLAHLIDLSERGLVARPSAPSVQARYRRL